MRAKVDALPVKPATEATESGGGSQSDVVGALSCCRCHAVPKVVLSQSDDATTAELQQKLAEKRAELERVREEYTALREQLSQGRGAATRSAPRVSTRPKGELVGRKVAAPEWYWPNAVTPIEGEIVAELPDLGRAVVRWPQREAEYTYGELQPILADRKRRAASSSVRVGPKFQVRLPPPPPPPPQALSRQYGSAECVLAEGHNGLCCHEFRPQKRRAQPSLPLSPAVSPPTSRSKPLLKVCGTPGCRLPDLHHGPCECWLVEGKRQRIRTSQFNTRLPSLHTVAAVNGDFVGCKVEAWYVPGHGLGLFARECIKRHELFAYYELFVHRCEVRDAEYSVQSHELGVQQLSVPPSSPQLCTHTYTRAHTHTHTHTERERERERERHTHTQLPPTPSLPCRRCSFGHQGQPSAPARGRHSICWPPRQRLGGWQ